MPNSIPLPPRPARRPHARRGRVIRSAIAVACLSVLLANLASTYGQPDTPASEFPAIAAIPADELTPAPAWSPDAALADPVIAADAQLKAQRAYAWSQGSTRFVALEGDVSVSVGAYGFRADRVVVRIDVERPPGLVLKHLAVYFDNARSLRGRGPVTAEAPHLLVTVTTKGDVQLATDLLEDRSQANDPFVAQAMGRFERHLASTQVATLDVPAEGSIHGELSAAARQARRQEIEAQRREALLARLPSPQAPPEAPQAQVPPVAKPPEPVPEPAAPAPAIMPAQGTLAFNADRIVYQPGEGDEATVSLIGSVRVLYTTHDGVRKMSLQAENAVLFVEQDSAGGTARQTEAGKVRGIYLEDNVVATDGEYTMRGPRVYYDLASNKAIVLEAVLYTYDLRQHIPLYLRARQLRQVSRQSWVARDAQFTTSDFGEPHFAIRASRMTYAQQRTEDGRTSRHISMTNSVFKFGYVPVFYWPYVAGEADQRILRTIGVGYSANEGPRIQTTWDLFALAGREAPAGVDLTGQLDYRGDHGPAVGLNLKYALPKMYGAFDSYLLLFDSGQDDVGGRAVGHSEEVRGYTQWQHRHYLPQNFELSVEFNYVSDPTFVEEFYRDKAEADKQWETSAYLKKQERDWAFTILTQYNLNDFTTQTTTLQTPGYDVEKLPELGYYRIGTALWDDRLTYFTENRLSFMRINGGDDAPIERGFGTIDSMLRFGIPNTTRFEDGLYAAGVPQDYRMRFDSRHEINAPLRIATVDVTPYVAGRLTAYDEDFAAFAGESDNLRLMGAAGVRMHTQFNHQYNAVDWPLLDVYRLRHIVEPSGDVFQMVSTLNPEDLPVYDSDVEGLEKGFGARMGLRNTLQTQRGGPGRWRSVDWIVLDTDLVVRSDDADVTTPISRYFGYRPEYSTGGDHFYSRAFWAITDSLAAAGDATYSLERDDLEQYGVSLMLRHSARLTIVLGYQAVEPLDSKILRMGMQYELTRLYSMGVSYAYDFGEDRSYSLKAVLERKIPGWRILFTGQYDVINDDQFIGVQLFPEGQATPQMIAPPLGVTAYQ
ncbi:MAG: LPS assembly protein LptD [Phycisphaeraceae bacterium]